MHISVLNRIDGLSRRGSTISKTIGQVTNRYGKNKGKQETGEGSNFVFPFINSTKSPLSAGQKTVAPAPENPPTEGWAPGNM